MDLPAELRLQIYSHLHRFRYVRLAPTAAHTRTMATVKWTKYAVPPALLYVSHTIRAEVRDGILRANLSCAPTLVCRTSPKTFYDKILASLKLSHEQDMAWLRNNAPSSENSPYRIDSHLLANACENLLASLNELNAYWYSFSRTDLREEADADVVEDFVKWSLLRLRKAQSMNLVIHLPASQSLAQNIMRWDTSRGQSFWNTIKTLKQKEQAGLLLAHRYKFVLAPQVELAAVEDAMGGERKRNVASEFRITWEIASPSEHALMRRWIPRVGQV
jgi:hypothetical protein